MLDKINPLIDNGFKVIANDMACVRKEWVQIRKPKSKKKRVRLKFRKNNKNWEYKTVEHFFKVQNTIIVSRRLFEELKKDCL